jgi:choline-glycine betaine transporter
MGLRNDTGTISAIPYALLTLIIVGLTLVAFGPVIDEVTAADTALISLALPYSEQRQETLTFLEMCWGALAVSTVFCVVIFLLMNGAQRDTGGV